MNTTVFQLRNVEVSHAAAVLQSLLSPECKIAADPRQNVLIGSGPSAKLEALKDLIQEIDSAKPVPREVNLIYEKVT